MSRFEPLSYPALLAHLLPVLLLAGIASADPCSDCKSKFQYNCSQTCGKFKGQSNFAQCNQNCVNAVCTKQCRSGNTAPPAKAKPMSCDECIKAMTPGCNTGCPEGAKSALDCKKRCVAQKCDSSCDLPTIDLGDEAEDPRAACHQCRDEAYERCAKDSRCSPGQPGYEGCRMACSVEQCARECS